MALIRVKGHITADGHIEDELPDNFIAGEIELDIPISVPTLSAKSLGDILQSGLVGIGADAIPEDVDSQTWVEQEREKRKQDRGQSWTDS